MSRTCVDQSRLVSYIGVTHNNIIAIPFQKKFCGRTIDEQTFIAELLFRMHDVHKHMDT